MSKTIWIDLDNSPHVPFFRPIIRELEKRRKKIIISARDCFQTCGLADIFGLKYQRIGRHYGKNRILKVAGTLYRALQLVSFIIKYKPDLAVSHGSRAQLIAAYIGKVPMIELDDYEHSQAVGFIKPSWKIVPEVIAEKFSGSNLLTYPGIKEDVYVPDFTPDDSVLKVLGLKEEDFIVTIRPPATEAHYHNPESEEIFEAVVEYLGKLSFPDVKMVILPRNEKIQGEFIRNKWPKWCMEKKIIIPREVVNGLDLIWFSDLVISGGGTMNREAAALSVPVFSIFRGPIGEVDKFLCSEGRLVLIESRNEIPAKIKLEPRNKRKFVDAKDRKSLETIVEYIEKLAEKEG